jgi:hypothetical protein
VYKQLGAEKHFIFRVGDGPHNFPQPVREEAYRWLAGRLREAADAPKH